MRLLIVDDEFHSRRIIRKYIEEEFCQFTSISEASNFEEAVTILAESKIDLLILDILLDNKTGFDILKLTKSKNFEIIFITAYDNFALEAFNVGAINYILKPIVKEKLITTVNKAILLLEKSEKAMSNPSNEVIFDKILIPHNNTSKFIAVSDLIYVEADSSYCTLILRNEKIIISKPLSFIQEKLQEHPNFYRIHKSYLINLDFVSELSNDGNFVKMNNDELLVVSRLKKVELKEMIFNRFY